MVDIYKSQNSSKPFPSKKRKIGLILLFTWFMCLALFIPFAFYGPYTKLIMSLVGGDLIMKVLFFSILLLLPLSIFFIGNKIFKAIGLAIIGFVIFLFLLNHFVMRTHKIVGGSMAPNFISGGYAFSDLLTYKFSEP